MKIAKWIIIQTNLAHQHWDPMFSLVEVSTLPLLMEELDKADRNDMLVTAVPYRNLMTAMKELSLETLAAEIYEMADGLGALDRSETSSADRCRKDFKEGLYDLLKEGLHGK